MKNLCRAVYLKATHLSTLFTVNVLVAKKRFAIQGPYSSFVRVLLLRGKMIGAVLIGDTELEEAFENLILDSLDLSSYGPALLDPDMEIGHIFD